MTIENLSSSPAKSVDLNEQKHSFLFSAFILSLRASESGTHLRSLSPYTLFLPKETDRTQPLKMRFTITLVALAAALASAKPLHKRQANIQTFDGALGGVAATPVVDSGNADRPFQVKDATFVNIGAALQRSCDQQFNGCANIANANGQADFSVSDCQAQKSEPTPLLPLPRPSLLLVLTSSPSSPQTSAIPPPTPSRLAAPPLLATTTRATRATRRRPAPPSVTAAVCKWGRTRDSPGRDFHPLSV